MFLSVRWKTNRKLHVWKECKADIILTQAVRLQRIVGILIVTLVIALSVTIFFLGDQLEKLALYGYPGVFLLGALTSASVGIPGPGLALVFVLGRSLNPFWVGVLAGAGTTLGEIPAYLAGFGGSAIAGDHAALERINRWLEKHPRFAGLLIFFLAVTPLPFFDFAAIAVGALKLPLRQFVLFALPGKIIKMLVLAYLGAETANL